MVEVWKEVDGHPLYEVSDQGRVRSWNGMGRASVTRARKPRVLSRKPARDGRVTVTLGRGNFFRVSELVCEAFHGSRPDGMECCHNNGKPWDNRASNLRWDTRAGNHADKLKHGTHSRGERHGASKLTERKVEQIIRDVEKGASHSATARKFGVARQTIGKIVNGKRWSWRKAA